MVLPDGPTPQKLMELGVSRISYGPIPYSHAMGSLRDAGRKALANSDMYQC